MPTGTPTPTLTPRAPRAQALLRAVGLQDRADAGLGPRARRGRRREVADGVLADGALLLCCYGASPEQAEEEHGSSRAPGHRSAATAAPAMVVRSSALKYTGAFVDVATFGNTKRALPWDRHAQSAVPYGPRRVPISPLRRLRPAASLQGLLVRVR